MAKYQYNALDKDGRAVSGAIAADSRDGAISALAADGVFVTDLHDPAAAAGPPRGPGAGRKPAP